MSDTIMLLSALGAVIGFVVPTIWHLATKIEKLSGVIETSAEGTRQRLSGLEGKMAELSEEIKENRKDKQLLGERLTVVETKLGQLA